MFDIGLGEILLLLVAGLVVVGPERLPKYAADAARVIRGLRGQISDAKNSINDAVSLDPELMRDLRDLNPKRLLDEPETRQHQNRNSPVDPDTT